MLGTAELIFGKVFWHRAPGKLTATFLDQKYYPRDIMDTFIDCLDLQKKPTN